MFMDVVVCGCRHARAYRCGWILGGYDTLFFLMLIHFYVYSYNCLFLESLTTHSLTLLTHQCKNVVMQKKQKINEI